MKKLFIVFMALGVAFVFLVATSTPSAAGDDKTVVPGDVPFVFVGHTSVPINASQGIVGLTAYCQNEVAANSRVCTTEEYMNSVDFSAATSNNPAWIRPTIVGYASGVAVDASGRKGDPETELTCEGWTSNKTDGSVKGIRVDLSSGRFFLQNCGNLSFVACCGPAP